MDLLTLVGKTSTDSVVEEVAVAQVAEVVPTPVEEVATAEVVTSEETVA